MKKWFSFLAISLFAFSLIPVMAQSGIEIIGGDEATMRAFIERMMGPGPYDTDSVSIYVAQLPEDLPFDLPVPEGASIIGATVRAQSYTDILLDTDLEPQAVRAFYIETLSGDEWRDVSQNLQGGGFRPGPADAQFCYQGMEAQLNIFASENLSGSTDIRVYIQEDADPYLCATDPGAVGRPPSNDPYQLIPALDTPDGVTVRDIGSGGGGGRPSGPTSAFQTATLETGLTPDEVAAAYNVQLEESGWEQVSIGSDNSVAWSMWTLVDSDDTTWAGTLIIHASPLEENVYSAFIQVSAAPAQE